MDDLWNVVPTSDGTARVRLVDRWLAVATTGDLLERDVWEVAFVVDDVEVVRRMRTLPEPDEDSLGRAVHELVRVVHDAHGA